MTADDSARDDARRDSDGEPADPDAQPQTPLDEEAAWRLIVQHYGERPSLEDPAPPANPGASADADPPVDGTLPADQETTRPAAPQRPGHDPLDRSYLDALDAERTAPVPREDRRRNDPSEPVDEAADRGTGEHFVPPDPPPVPRATPARRIAWGGLFLPPLLMLAAVVLDWTFPSWVALGLVAAFVGGFVFLVATMPRDGGDGWGDGAVV